MDMARVSKALDVEVDKIPLHRYKFICALKVEHKEKRGHRNVGIETPACIVYDEEANEFLIVVKSNYDYVGVSKFDPAKGFAGKISEALASNVPDKF